MKGATTSYCTVVWFLLVALKKKPPRVRRWIHPSVSLFQNSFVKAWDHSGNIKHCIASVNNTVCMNSIDFVNIPVHRIRLYCIYKHWQQLHPCLEPGLRSSTGIRSACFWVGSGCWVAGCTNIMLGAMSTSQWVSYTSSIKHKYQIGNTKYVWVVPNCRGSIGSI